MEGEKEELLNSLTAGREHVLGILDGLSSEALHRAVLPSSWTCLPSTTTEGLVPNLRGWCRQTRSLRSSLADTDARLKGPMS